jgi:hypothetical protein
MDYLRNVSEERYWLTQSFIWIDLTSLKQKAVQCRLTLCGNVIHRDPFPFDKLRVGMLETARWETCRMVSSGALARAPYYLMDI